MHGITLINRALKTLFGNYSHNEFQLRNFLFFFFQPSKKKQKTLHEVQLQFFNLFKIMS